MKTTFDDTRLKADLRHEWLPSLEINNIEKPYSYTAAQIRLLFSEDSIDWDIFPEFNEHEFTVYKNKKGLDYFKSCDIPLDGSMWMYRVLHFEGEEIIHSLLQLIHPEQFKLECDPRARTSSRWVLAGPEMMHKVKVLFHIMGLREMLTVSRVLIPEGVEVSE